jgi:ribonuclease HI
MSSTLYWELYVDGSFNYKGCCVGVVLISPHRQVFEYDIHFEFSTTNNVSEYEVVLGGLGLIEDLEAFPLHVQGDSQLIVGKFQGVFKTRESTLMKYLQKIQTHLSGKDGGK